MKLFYKDTIGFSCLILIAIIGGMFLFENQSNIISISDHLEEPNEYEITKQIQRYVVDSIFVVIGMIIFMVCIIVMIMTFSRNPMLSNIKKLKMPHLKFLEVILIRVYQFLETLMKLLNYVKTLMKWLEN